MNFWLRNFIIGLILAVLAYILLANQDLLFKTAQDITSTEDTTSTGVDEVTKIEQPKKVTEKPKKAKKRSNAAADGLSKFYANLHGDDNDDGPKIVNNVVYLQDPKGDLVKLLEAKRMTTRPLRKNWRGDKESRPFRLGQTLFQKLYEYAEEQGLEVIWWLNRDLVVKDAFRINKDIVKTTYLIGKAIEGHFFDGISTYFCYQQRTLVLIDEALPYLDEECILLTTDTK